MLQSTMFWFPTYRKMNGIYIFQFRLSTILAVEIGLHGSAHAGIRIFIVIYRIIHHCVVVATVQLNSTIGFQMAIVVTGETYHDHTRMHTRKMYNRGQNTFVTTQICSIFHSICLYVSVTTKCRTLNCPMTIVSAIFQFCASPSKTILKICTGLDDAHEFIELLLTRSYHQKTSLGTDLVRLALGRIYLFISTVQSDQAHRDTE